MANDQRYAIVTGVAIGGIGYYISKGLAERGYNVTLACRNQQKTQVAIDELVKHGISRQLLTYENLDVSVLGSVKSFADRYIKSNKPLHVLVNNAGIYKGEITTDGIEGVFATNYLGHFALCELLTPVLIQSQPSRIINVSSMMHRFARIDYIDASKHAAKTAYSDSKLYQIMAGRELHRRLRSQGVSVYSVHPGAVLSNFYSFVGPRAEKIMKLVMSNWFISAQQGALTALSCIFDQPSNTAGQSLYVSPHAPILGSSTAGELLGSCWSINVSQLQPSKYALDDETGQKLYEFSQQLYKNKLSML